MSFARLRMLGSKRAAVLGAALALLVSLPALAAFAAAPEERLAPCLACHGDQGQSAIPGVPSLGAQQAFYLTTQLYMFRERMRVVEPMNAMTKGLSDDDLRALANAISKLPPPAPVAGAPDPARAERARALIAQNRCNFCHNMDYSGAENAPRLAGQREDYLIKALSDYKNNTRRAYDTSMADVIYPLTEANIRDLADYLSHQR